MKSAGAIVLFTICLSPLEPSMLLADSLGDNWPQWRGPARDGSVSAQAWPRDLSSQSLKASWSIPLGPSYSGPIVSDDLIFITETKDRRYEIVRALDRDTGKQVWEARWEGSMQVPFFAAANGSWIRATPAFDGERLYVAGMRDVLVCLNAQTGVVEWRKDFVMQTNSPLPQFGFVSSPLVLGDHVYVQAGASLSKLDKRTGAISWQSLRDSGAMFGGAFSSPIHAVIAGVPQIVVQTRSKLAGVDLERGNVLWATDVPAFRGMNILTPTVFGDSVFTSSYGGRSKMFTISKNGPTWRVSESWTHKSQGYMSSPVAIEDHIYLHLRNQRVVCLDARNGAGRWTTRPFGKYWSMVANGTQLLALDQTGELLLIDASPDKFQLVARRRVADDAWAHLAVAGKDVFVRDLRAIKAFTWEGE